MAIRKNASLDALTTATFHRANRALKEALKWSTANDRRGREGHVEFSDRCRESDAWDRYRELDEIATHLLRLTGHDAKTIEALKDDARRPKKEVTNV